jgi:hypothetical protein
MSDAKSGTHEEVHGISSAVDYGVGPEDTPQVIAGYGETAKREGAKTKEVHNVSKIMLTLEILCLPFIRPISLLLLRKPRLSGGARHLSTFTVRFAYQQRQASPTC